MSDPADWRAPLLAGCAPPPEAPAEPGGPDWPGYRPRPAVQWADGSAAGHPAVLVWWDFGVHGGSFGAADADRLAAACSHAVETGRPLLTLIRSGGTRLQEGVAALVGIPRALLALQRVADAGLPHICVADHPTTGGVWVGVAATADLRLGIAGATVGFSGPRMVEAMTGATLPAGANTAESAVTAGLVDAVVPGPAALDWLARALAAFAPLPAPAVTTMAVVDLPPMPAAATGWQQVRAARRGQRPDGHVLIRSVLGDCVPLRGADDTVAAAVGHIASGQAAVAVAVAATRGGRPTPAGYALLTRSARLADRLRLPLVTLVDTPGADPSPASEAGGLAPRMAEAMAAMLACRTPTVAVVHGEGGSGGALAAAVADEVLVTEFGYFAALAPEGAAATLHLDAETAADRVGLGPADLVRLGFARPVAAAAAPQAVAAVIQRLQQIGGGRLTARRKERWAGRLRNP